jgi:serine/threonine-protein kinase/endoribonuclease IRE1
VCANHFKNSDVTGSGSQGTFVYEGTWENIRVAVKRMQIENFEIADKEVDHLRESDEHPNIVRYYTNKRSDKFIYIALELCPATLEQVIVHGNKEPFCQLAGPNLQKQYALAQIASGLQFLHSLKIVHRDLKPQNILVAPPKLRHATTGSPLWRHYKQDQTRCLISDFGLCKKLEPDHSTFQAQSTMAAGTSGWRAPEVLRGVENEKKGMPSGVTSDTTALVPGSDRRITRAVDIFSMGCLFYYVLTDGEHPFGSLTYLRDGRIMDNQYDLTALDCSTNDGVEARDLIARMIAPNPCDRYLPVSIFVNIRPNAVQVLRHPYFWDEKRRMDFILELSDRLNLEQRDPPSLLLQRVESASAEICGKDWTHRIDDAFMKDSRVNRSYDGKKINDLIRLIRNKVHFVYREFC